MMPNTEYLLIKIWLRPQRTCLFVLTLTLSMVSVCFPFSVHDGFTLLPNCTWYNRGLVKTHVLLDSGILGCLNVCRQNNTCDAVAASTQGFCLLLQKRTLASDEWTRCFSYTDLLVQAFLKTGYCEHKSSWSSDRLRCQCSGGYVYTRCTGLASSCADLVYLARYPDGVHQVQLQTTSDQATSETCYIVKGQNVTAQDYFNLVKETEGLISRII